MVENLEIVQEEEVKKLPKGVCYLCEKKMKDHSDNDLLDCLSKIVEVPDGFRPLESVGDALQLTIGRVAGTTRIRQDQRDFILTFGKREIKTQTPARDIVKFLIETYKGD